MGQETNRDVEIVELDTRMQLCCVMISAGFFCRWGPLHYGLGVVAVVALIVTVFLLFASVIQKFDYE